MKSDILITTWNCVDCASVKQLLKEEAIYDDEFTGNSNQTLSLVQAFSNSGTQAILEKFEFPEDVSTPVLITHDETRWWVLEDIISYLKEQGFLNAEES